MLSIAAVAAGGAIGSVARYLAGLLATQLFGSSFPWGTLVINVTGSFLMGVLVALLAKRWNSPDFVEVFLTVGVCGGYTTFSTFSLDAYDLIEKSAGLEALAYVVASAILSIGALAAAMLLLRSLPG